jgi:hypothetical protein
VRAKRPPPGSPTPEAPPRPRDRRRRGRNLKRPLPPGAPPHLARGTEEYRRWEAGQILTLAAAGLSVEQIETRLLLSRDEYRDRLAWLKAHAQPGDSVLAWLHFLAACSRRMLDCERVLAAALERSNLPVAIATIGKLHDIDVAKMKYGFEYGIFPRQPSPPAEGGATSPAPAAVTNNVLVQILRHSDGIDPANLTHEQLAALLPRMRAELVALGNGPDVPTIGPGAA